MAFYDYEKNKIVTLPSELCEKYPGWEKVDCGCCAGIEWGGDYPKECKRCGGSGYVCRHIKSGVYAQYPGGPFC